MNFKVKKEDILFLDIETVPLHENFEKLSELEKSLFSEKTLYRRGDVSVEDFYKNAGIWAEFGKIVCISVGFFYEKKLRIKSFVSKEEKSILMDFKNLLEQYFNRFQNLLCGHNLKEFDLPFIARRMIINSIDLPEKLFFFGKKPWEISHLDTLDLWKFGDYKHYTSLALLAFLLNVPSSKDDIDGSQVSDFFYKKKDLLKISTYCEQDVLALVRVFMRLNNEEIVSNEDIIYVK